jgi:DNA modification methylase
MTVRILCGDVRERLAELPDESVDSIVTSPPYFKQRDYGIAGQLGREPTPEAFAEALSGVASDLWRVLRNDGAFWLNIGDTYAAGGNGGGGSLVAKRRQWTGAHERKGWRRQAAGFKEKDITLAPFVLADTLRADGWYLRGTIIWDKQVATEPPRLDRPSTAYEYLFLLSKSEKYKCGSWRAVVPLDGLDDPAAATYTGHPGRNARELARRCIVCSSAPGDTVLDPFGGSARPAWWRIGLPQRHPDRAQPGVRRDGRDAHAIAAAAGEVRMTFHAIARSRPQRPCEARTRCRACRSASRPRCSSGSLVKPLVARCRSPRSCARC